MNLLEENEVLEKNKDDYELLGITWGKYYQKKRKLNRFFKYLKRNYFSPDKGYNVDKKISFVILDMYIFFGLI